MATAIYRRCGRKVKRTKMTSKQLQASIKWCKMEIAKLQKELNKRNARTI